MRVRIGRRKRTRKQLENDVSARMIRQRRLSNEEAPLSPDAIIDEAALRKPIGGDAVMRAQLLHLVEAAKLDTVTLQIIPNSVGAHEGMEGSFTVLEFLDPEDPSLLYAEYPTGAVHVEKPEEVRESRLIFEQTCARLRCHRPTRWFSLSGSQPLGHR